MGGKEAHTEDFVLPEIWMNHASFRNKVAIVDVISRSFVGDTCTQ